MNKIALLSIISLSLIGGAMAQAKKPIKKEAPKTAIACAVMPEDQVNIAKATTEGMFADHKGRRYFFCCAGCPGAFKKNPEKFAKNASIATPKPAKQA